jgi:N-acetylglucosaminyldiphosphoundecaprenol N-acetyl-beta-D-mannosaminyltransferase
MTSENHLPFRNVIGFPVVALPFDAQIALMMEWAKGYLSKVVCIANVHMLTEAYGNPDFADVLTKADLVTPDGMPLVWMLKLMGAAKQDRVAGVDVLLALCKSACSEDISIFFLGSQSAILEKMRQRLEVEFPTLKIAGMEPLPFRPMTESEDEAIVQTLNASGAGLVFVSLGCPKQELWMTQHQGRVQAVMIGLGGAFPVYAGIHKRAPKVIRNSGFEWLYRLAQEPKRLWGRYSSTIPIFMWLALKQLLDTPRSVHSQELQ